MEPAVCWLTRPSASVLSRFLGFTMLPLSGPVPEMTLPSEVAAERLSDGRIYSTCPMSRLFGLKVRAADIISSSSLGWPDPADARVSG